MAVTDIDGGELATLLFDELVKQGPDKPYVSGRPNEAILEGKFDLKLVADHVLRAFQAAARQSMAGAGP